MNPRDFNWSEDQQVTVINPTDQPFKFKVHSKDYQIGANKSAKMPGYIAWVYVYNMASYLAQQVKYEDGSTDFDKWNEEGFRQSYYEQLVKNVDQLINEVAEEPEEFGVESFDEEDNNADGPETEFDDEDKTQDQKQTATTAKVKPMQPAKAKNRR